MIIMAKTGGNIVNLDHVENIFLSADGKSIKANMASRSGCELAKYSTIEQSKYALGMLFSAAQGDERVFSFPEEIDINIARQHRSKVSSRKVSHGGS